MLRFMNDEHKKFFLSHCTPKSDVYFKSLVYTLGLLSETRKNFSQLFDIEKKLIRPDELDASWQTSGTMRTCRLAFNLWNNYTGNRNDESASSYTVSSLFCAMLAPWYWEAVKIRYPEITDEDL